MPKPFLIESFEKHKAKGVARFRMGELDQEYDVAEGD